MNHYDFGKAIDGFQKRMDTLAGLKPDILPNNINERVLMLIAYTAPMLVAYRYGGFEPNGTYVKSTPKKDTNYFASAIVAVDKVIKVLSCNDDKVSPNVLNFFLFCDLTAENNNAKAMRETLIEGLQIYKKTLLEPGHKFFKNSKKYADMRNAALTKLANELTHNHGYGIDEARYAAGKTMEIMGVEIPGMSSYEVDRKRTLQSIMPDVTKP